MKTEPVPRCISIIDDDVMVRLLATQALEQAGYAVESFGDAEAGLEAFRTRRHDLVLLDVVLPGIDGFAACRQLRQIPWAANVPVIILTGLDDTGSIHEAYESGATDFITKPLNWSLLGYRVRYALRARETLVALEKSGSSLNNAQRIARLGSWEWWPHTGVVQRSEECCRIYGMPPAAPVPIGEALERVHADDRAYVSGALDATIKQGVPYALDFRIVRPGGDLRTVHEQVEVVRNEAGNVVRVEGITQDITEHVQARERIRYLGHFDMLTGLPNRVLFRELAEAALQRARRQEQGCALLFLNLDRFQRINETFGHVAGDLLLQEIAHRIDHGLRAGDVKGAGTALDARSNHVARIGGDEFTILLVDVPRPEDAARVAHRVLEAVARPVQLKGIETSVTASVGIASYPHDAGDFEGLLKGASTAVHTAKSEGRNSYRFYSSDMGASALERLGLENDLRRALQLGEFELHYQPKVAADSGMLIGAEALLRWKHPVLGLLAPAKFIPIAEESGMILPIGEWVLESACRQVGAWARAGLAVVPIAINLSAPNFQNPELPDLIGRSLTAARISPDLLEIELTESILMQDFDVTTIKLKRIKDKGISLAIDDFGTGYSSLAYLRRFPVDTLKIDRSFISGIDASPHDAAITAAIIALARNLLLDVVAEGVETASQARFLLERGCTKMQGFYYARPMPAREFEVILRPENKHWAAWSACRAPSCGHLRIER